MKRLSVIGIGPGGRDHMTLLSIKRIEEADVVVGYKPYLDYIEDLVIGKEIHGSSMGKEIERVKLSLDLAREDKKVILVSTGDAGLYGMAGPVYEMSEEYEDVEIEVVPGVSSAFSAAAHLGAPLMQDSVLISLSDLMNSWDLIKERVHLASKGDFCIAIYNPKSKTRVSQIGEAMSIIKSYRDENTPVGIVKNAGRPGTYIEVCKLKDFKDDLVDMMTLVIIGNSQSKIIKGKIVTPRGYRL